MDKLLDVLVPLTVRLAPVHLGRVLASVAGAPLRQAIPLTTLTPAQVEQLRALLLARLTGGPAAPVALGDMTAAEVGMLVDGLADGVRTIAVEYFRERQVVLDGTAVNAVYGAFVGAVVLQ